MAIGFRDYNDFINVAGGERMSDLVVMVDKLSEKYCRPRVEVAKMLLFEEQKLWDRTYHSLYREHMLVNLLGDSYKVVDRYYRRHVKVTYEWK